MKAQSLLLALAATLSLAVAEVANGANMAATNEVAAAENMVVNAGTAEAAGAADLQGALDYSSSEEEWSDDEFHWFKHKDPKKDHKRKKPSRKPEYDRCRSGDYACDWDKKNGPGIKVCQDGRWRRTNDCPRRQQCYYNKRNKTPYCLPGNY